MTDLKALFTSKLAIAHLKNSSWMVLERVLRLISSLVVGIYLARYLGPSDFGLLNYTVAFVAIFLPFVELGFSSILIREFISEPDEKRIYGGTAFYMTLGSSIVIIAVINTVSFLVNKNDYLFHLIFIYSLALVFKPFQIIDFHYQSQLRSKKSSIIKSIVLIITAVLKIVLIRLDAPLVYFIYVYGLDIVLLSILFISSHFFKQGAFFFPSFKKKICLKLLKSVWPMIVSGLAVLLYMRTDQIMIQNMLSERELGLYSAATRIYEGIVMVSIVLTISFLPAIVKLKEKNKEKYSKYLTMFFSFLFWSNNLLALLITFFGKDIVEVLFGKDFLASSSVLIIISWAVGFASFGSLSSRYFTAENMEKKLLFRTLLALLVNIILNIVFIPVYGINGSAVATLISLILGNYVIDYFDPELKSLIRMKNNALKLYFK